MKLLVDTSIYVDFLRTGRHADLTLEVQPGRLAGLFPSAVVAHELVRGARSAADLRDVRRLVEPFRSRGRLLAPETADWLAAGAVLRRLRTRIPLDDRHLTGLVNDTLLSVQARRVGACLVTTDQDFGLIRRALDFELELRRTAPA